MSIPRPSHRALLRAVAALACTAVVSAGLAIDIDKVPTAKRSGIRSNHAAGLLATKGFTRAYTVIDGFEGDTAKDGERKGQRVVNGWKNANLPWGYKLAKDKMYLEDF